MPVPVLALFPGESSPRPAVLCYQVGDWCVLEDDRGARWKIHRAMVCYTPAASL